MDDTLRHYLERMSPSYQQTVFFNIWKYRSTPAGETLNCPMNRKVIYVLDQILEHYISVAKTSHQYYNGHYTRTTLLRLPLCHCIAVNL